MRPGARGDAVRDVQRRLARAGFLPAGVVVPGVFCPATEQALSTFQQVRGLRCSGICDDNTWHTLVEASWSLGDRVLFHTSPMMRGDDIAEVQDILGRLGFDAGRVDGIYGPDTAAAVADFQRNCGLVVDGSCGRDTVVALQRLSRHSGQGPGVATVREIEQHRLGHRSLAHHRLVIGHFGGVGPVVRSLARVVRGRGAEVITLDDPDPHLQAQAANRFEAQAYVGLEAQAGPGAELAYYAVGSFTSGTGQSLAHHITRGLESGPFPPPLEVSTVGLRLPILRETRMTAVMITLGPVRHVVDQSGAIARVIADAFDEWFPPPLD